MQARAIPVALLVVALALAGCVNTPKDTATVDPSTAGSTPTGTNAGTGAAGVVRVLLPLNFALATDAPAWVAPGDKVPLRVTGAQSGWTFTWAQGSLPGTAKVDVKLDTGSKSPATDYIQPGGAKALTFSTAGAFLMHCHPHPYMLSNVTVIDGYAGPKEVHVQIVDGSKASESRFIPENIVVGTGTRVVYHNNGTQPHTATLMTGEPPLKKLDVTGASAELAIQGSGWQRIRVVAQDAGGRIGTADHAIYVADIPTFKPDPVTFDFTAGGLPEQAVAAKTYSFLFEHGGTLYLNFTAKDAPAQNGAPANNAQVTIHLAPQGSTQDALTATDKAEGNLSAALPAGSYTLKIMPVKGVGVKGSVMLEGLYAPVPPAPAAPGGGHDGHGGGGGHNH